MSTSRHTLVLHVTNDTLRLVRVQVGRETTELSDACTFCSPNSGSEGATLRDATVLDALAAYVRERGYAGQDAVCLIGGASVACHYYDMPPLKGSAMRQAVRLKAAQQLHFDIGKAVVAVDPLGRARDAAGQNVRVSATALQQDVAEAAVAAAERADLKLLAITAAPSALTALATDLQAGGDGLAAYLHLDDKVSTLIVLDGARPVVTSDLTLGTDDLTSVLMRPIIAGDDVIQLDQARAAALRDEVGVPLPDQLIESLGVTGDRVLPLLEPVIQKLAKQLTQWLTFASTSGRRGPVQSVRLVGLGAGVPRLADTIAARISVPTVPHRWLDGCVTAATSIGSVANLGAVVGAAGHWRRLPDLLPSDARRRRTLARVRRGIVVHASAAAVALTGAGLLFGGIESRLRPVRRVQDQQRDSVTGMMQQGIRWAAVADRLGAMERDLARFTSETPLWIGLFKELSMTLPREFRADGFATKTVDGRLHLIVTGHVHGVGEARGFEDFVERSLHVLECSPFFSRVVVNANRSENASAEDITGAISMDLTLAYARPA